MNGLSLTVFGGLTAALNDQPLPRLPTVRAQGLLIFLAVENALGSTVQRRETLMELLWPGMPPQSSRKNLRTTLYYLRQAIDDYLPDDAAEKQAIPFLLSDRSTLQINPMYPVNLDLERFLQLLDGPGDGWLEAIDIYQDDFLAGFFIPNANPFEEWATARRSAFRRRLLQALEALAAESSSAGDFEEAERLARRQLEIDPLRESAWRQLMESLARRGRRGEALSEYEACVEILWKELGVEPATETEQLRQEIVTGTLAPTSEVTTTSSPAEKARQHNLPAQTTPFIGRERQVAEVAQLLESARLVTLTGPGGTGKTRLAQQVAASTAALYDDGLTFVALASTTEPDLVANAIAKELGVVERTGRPLAEQIGHYLAKRQHLLLLDNFEQVLEAATLVSDLLAAAPGLRVLVTSREVLSLHGEHVYLVPPLAVPDPARGESLAELSEVESVQLFVQRARAASANFQLTEENALAIAAICTRLDGLPLAIELAAARTKLFSPQQLLERLESALGLLTGGARDAPDRQRTLRATIDWSYDLLDEDEQILFARLAVFTGGRSLRAVEAVCGPGLAIDALTGLESLLNKSLLYQEEGPDSKPRFIMLETIHEYARERLAASGEEPRIRKRHLEYFLSLVEEMEPGYRRHGQLVLMDQTAAEMGNLRAAFSWAMENGQIEAAARLVSAIDYLFRHKGPLVEGYRLIKRVLDMDTLEQIPPQYQLRLLLAAGRLAWINDQDAQSITFLQRALALSRALDDQSSLAWALVELASLATSRLEEYEEAVGLCEDGLAIFRELDDKPGAAYGLNVLGELERFAGDYGRARRAYETSLDICRETGEIVRESVLLMNLTFVTYDEGDYARAKDYATSVMRQGAETGWNLWLAVPLVVLAGPVAKLGEPEKATRLLSASAAIRRMTGVDMQPQDRPRITKYIADVQALLDEETYETAWAEGQAMTPEQAVAYALED